MTTLAERLATYSDRCRYGFSIEHHHPLYCECTEGSEWAVFVAALKQARKPDGSVHVNDVRPLIKGRITSKHIGQLWQKARREYLLKLIGHEDSTDVAGKNADKIARVYRWIGAAS